MLLVVFKKSSSFSDTWETDYLWVLLGGGGMSTIDWKYWKGCNLEVILIFIYEKVQFRERARWHFEKLLSL